MYISPILRKNVVLWKYGKKFCLSAILCLKTQKAFEEERD